MSQLRYRQIGHDVKHDDGLHRRIHRNDDGRIGVVGQVALDEIELVARIDLGLVHIVAPVEFEHDDADVLFRIRRDVFNARDRDDCLFDGARYERLDIGWAGSNIRRHDEYVGNLHIGIEIELKPKEGKYTKCDDECIKHRHRDAVFNGVTRNTHGLTSDSDN